MLALFARRLSVVFSCAVNVGLCPVGHCSLRQDQSNGPASSPKVLLNAVSTTRVRSARGKVERAAAVM